MQNNLQGEFVLNNTTSSQKTSEEKITQQDTPLTVPEQKQKKEPVKKILSQRVHNRPHFFSSYCEYPEGITFENQNPDEIILLLIRRDFITNLPWILGSILLAVVPFALASIITFIFPNLLLSQTTQAVILAFYYVVVFGFILTEFAIWYFNVALVTNQRIIDVDVSGILFKDVAETQLELVQDVSYNQNGAVRSIFDYGDILVQTAGTLPNFEFDRAPQPSSIVRIIGNLIDKEVNEKNP